MESEYDSELTNSPRSERDPLDGYSDNESSPDPPTALPDDFIASKFEMDELVSLANTFAERMTWIARRSDPDGGLTRNPKPVLVVVPGVWEVRVEVFVKHLDTPDVQE
jgi:hypothetical protein